MSASVLLGFGMNGQSMSNSALHMGGDRQKLGVSSSKAGSVHRVCYHGDCLGLNLLTTYLVFT